MATGAELWAARWRATDSLEPQGLREGRRPHRACANLTSASEGTSGQKKLGPAAGTELKSAPRGDTVHDATGTTCLIFRDRSGRVVVVQWKFNRRG